MALVCSKAKQKQQQFKGLQSLWDLERKRSDLEI